MCAISSAQVGIAVSSGQGPGTGDLTAAKANAGEKGEAAAAERFQNARGVKRHKAASGDAMAFLLWQISACDIPQINFLQGTPFDILVKLGCDLFGGGTSKL